MLASCAVTRHHLGPSYDVDIECGIGAWCPTDVDVAQMEEAFRVEYPRGLPVDVVRVKTFANDPFTDSYGRAVHGAFGRYWIECTGVGGWVHERIHVQIDSEDRPNVHPNGVWLDPEDSVKERRLKATLRAMLGRT